MRRIVLWGLSTLSALVLMFSYHTSTSGPSNAAPSSSFVSGTTPGRSSSHEATRGNSSSGTGSRVGKSPKRVSVPSGASRSTTVSGDLAQTQWGPVQVRLTVRDGTITKVSVPTYPNGNPRDTEINDYALPILVQETTNAQNARIDMVSGATVTSTGYLQSLQSALDRAGL